MSRMIIWLAVALLVLGSFTCGCLRTDEVYVNARATGPGNGSEESPFSTIAKGLIFVTRGGTIHVAPGDYFENLVIRKPLVLQGSGSGKSLLYADVTAKGIEVKSNDVEIAGFSIVGTGDPSSEEHPVAGIWAEDVDNLIIRGNTVSPYHGFGIAAADCTGVLIEDNELRQIADLPAFPGDSTGMNLHEVDGIVQNNTSSGNSVGVWVSGDKEGDFDLSLIGTRIEGNEHWGLVLLDAFRIADLSDNLIVNNGGPGITSLDVGSYLACQLAGGAGCEPPTTEIACCSNNLVGGNDPDFGYGFRLLPGCLSTP